MSHTLPDLELSISRQPLFFGLVVLVNIGIRADSSQRDLTRSRAELNAVTYADHMKADIVRGIDITNLAKPLDIEKMKNTIKDICP
ncbi:hypothetical protein [Coprococcus comes]|uniref:hypothetical protein n=1 Tax=Coprococcus comes TaxID=410072 RepID=UPI00189A01BA|nr:hypothetical protein [Coprococcus comes]